MGHPGNEILPLCAPLFGSAPLERLGVNIGSRIWHYIGFRSDIFYSLRELNVFNGLSEEAGFAETNAVDRNILSAVISELFATFDFVAPPFIHYRN